MERPTASRLSPPGLPPWLASLLPFERFALRADDRYMHVMASGPEAGSGAPVVLALHGNPTWGFLWRRVAAELAGHRVRLLMPDLVGLGLSEKPSDPAEHTLENHARWMGGLLDALGELGEEVDRLVFVGQDWGGPNGLRMLADRPEKLAGLVLLNTAVSPPKPGFQPTKFHRFANTPFVSTIAFRVFDFPQRALHKAQGDPSTIRGDVARAYRWPLRGWKRNAAPLALARMVPDSHDHPSIPGLRRTQEVIEAHARSGRPAEIVWGDRDPILGRLRSWVEKLLPDARVTATDAGHFLQEEVPKEIAAAIRRVTADAVLQSRP